MAWQTGKDFRKSITPTPLGPSVNIHVDSSPVINAVTATGGLLYAEKLQTDPLAVLPIFCPCCNRKITDTIFRLASACPGAQYMDGSESTTMVYQLECGCTVSQEWAGAFAAEITRRRDGRAPQRVVDMSEKQRLALDKLYRERLAVLGVTVSGVVRFVETGQPAHVRRMHEIEFYTTRLQMLYPGMLAIVESGSSKVMSSTWEGDEGAGYGSDVHLPKLGTATVEAKQMLAARIQPVAPVPPPPSPADNDAFFEQFKRKPRKIRKFRDS